MWRTGIEPSHVFIVIIGFAVLLLSGNPIVDIDAWWHVVIGRELIDTRTVSGLGDAWAIYQPADPWVTTQWLSEAFMAWTVDTFGWSGLVWARGIASVAFVVLVAALLLRFGPPRAAAATFALTVVPAGGIIQERPAMVSYLFLVGLSWWVCRQLLEDIAPAWWTVALYTWVWAQFHGLWVLAPAAFVVLVIGNIADDRRGWRRHLRRTGPVILAALVAGALTPAGLHSLTAPVRFAGAASVAIAEWQRTEPWNWLSLGLVGLLVILVAAWARSGDRVRLSILIHCAAWTALAMMAWRNIVPAAIMIAPVATAALSTTFGVRRAPTTGRERTALRIVTAAAVCVGGVWWISTYRQIDPFGEAEPLTIARYLQDQPRGDDGELRVLNSYNAAGILVAEGGSGLRLGIDGRTDRFGAERITEYLDLLGAADGWERTLADVDPDVAVLDRKLPLRHLLLADGWKTVLVDGDYLLMVPAAR